MAEDYKLLEPGQFSSVQFVYLPLRITWIEAKKKSNYLDSHGEEAQKKLAGL